MIGRGGRDRFRRDYSPRSEEKSHHHGRNIAPPSRHLWVGNLSHNITESILSEQFLRFGELDTIAFHPGRSYAFVNYRKEEDAIFAMRGLQGFILAGLPLKIEFAKAERSMASSHDEYQQRRDERHSVERGTPLFQKESRTYLTSPETFYTDKSRMGDKNAEPSEVLWIGFPSFLNVDDMVLRKAFSPFGEIEKITAFPGRSYAFVQFRSVVAARRAKEALQGKLFNNPRVSICFAKSEMSGHEHGRNSMNPPFSPQFKSNGHPGRSTEFRQDRKFGNSTGEPHRGSLRFISEFNSGDSGVIGFGGKGSEWTGGSGTFEPMRLQGPRPELGLPEDVYERHISPARERGPHRHDFSPGILPRKTPFYEDLSGMQDNNAFIFREAKKLKTGPFPPDKELPEYPFSNSAQEKQHIGLSKTFLDLPEQEAYEKNFGSGPFNYDRIPDQTMNLAHPQGERDDHWRAPYDRSETGPGSLPSNPVKWKVFTPEPLQSAVKDEWKWEGTIAKGGTPVCRARCFPVGKVVDVMLPEFLNCTARTGLDMLSKHFYQAASAWVVFFVPETDADIALYNEFMHYLGEKQRAAVAKLDEKTTLFLVPPSEFSEKVLKVPGKLSISGVILRFQHPTSDFGSLNQPLEAMDSQLPSFHEDISYLKPPSTDLRSSAWGPSQNYTNSSSESFPPLPSFTTLRKPEHGDLPILGNVPGSASSASSSGPTHLTGRVSETLEESRFFQPPQHQNPHLPSNWPPHHMQNSNLGTGNLPPQVSSNAHSSDHSVTKENLFMKPRVMQETTPNHYTPGISNIPSAGSNNFSQQETKSQVSTSLPIPSLQPDQLAHLASLLAQRQQSGSGPILSTEENQKQSNPVNHAEHSFLSSQKSSQNHASSDSSTLQFSQMHQLLQQRSNAPTFAQNSSAEVQMGAHASQGNQQSQISGAREEEADPQKRLQATLQLAAALLQQIQQQAKGPDQL